VVPQGSRADRVLLGLHGGGFVSGSLYTHRKMFGHLAKAVGARALLVDYRLLAEGGGYPAPADHESFMSNRDKDPSSSGR
jgi:epsilon-lactone hydrolase